MFTKEVYDPAKFKNVIVAGMQWGDESKGKMIAELSNGADIVARYNGGHNSGHNVVLNNVNYYFHLLPSGSMYQHIKLVLGTGVVIRLSNLLKEVELLEKFGVDVLSRLYISDRAQLLFDIHIELDCKQEEAQNLQGVAIGTTKSGIGPCYATKCFRTGVLVGELLHWEEFRKRVHMLFASVTDVEPERKADEEIARHEIYLKRIKHCIVDVGTFLTDAIRQGKNLLIEGANGCLLDINGGTYPYVTSSDTTCGGIYHGLLISPSTPVFRIGVLKAYQTRVGKGPFTTETFGEIFNKIQTVGQEFGVTTGRIRRCGWLDMVSVRYAQRINGFNVINLTKLDVLSALPEIKICVDYRNTNTGELYPRGSFPPTMRDFDYVEPIYVTFKGWNVDISNITKFEDLPKEAREYVEYIENDVGVWIQWIGVGKDISKTIRRL